MGGRVCVSVYKDFQCMFSCSLCNGLFEVFNKFKDVIKKMKTVRFWYYKTYKSKKKIFLRSVLFLI